MMKHLKGYKGFKQGLICRDKQYKENTVFEEDKAIVCSKGMHFCTNPLDVLDYYDLVNEDGTFSEYTEVEALADSVTDDNKKYCTTKLKIGVKLGFAGFIKACVNFLIEKTSFQQDDINSGDFAQIGSSGNFAQIGSSGNFAQIGSSGDFAQIGSSGNFAQIGSSGNSAQIGSSGNSAQIGSSGNSAKIGSSGNSAQIGSSGNSAQIGSSGNSAQIGSSGNFAQIGSSGDFAQIGSSGNSAQIGSSGDFAQIGSSGNSAQIGSSGNSAQIGSSGDFAQITSKGKHSVVMAAGCYSRVKAKIGSWITLVEWVRTDEQTEKGYAIWIPKCVRTEYVDGEHIKEDTFYKLKDGEFVEC